jgi:hypothetical protein
MRSETNWERMCSSLPGGKGSGRLTINFYSNEDLSRILEIMLGKPFDG